MKLKHFSSAIFISALATALNGLAIDRANAIILTFEGLQDGERVQDFYNGGSGSDGTNGGSINNYGVVFNTAGNNSGGIARNNGGVGPNNFSNPPGSPNPNNVLFFLGNDSKNNVLNIAGGFTSTFSFQYGNSTSNSTNAPAQVVRIYDGLDGSGNLLNSLTLLDNNGPSGISNWDLGTISFAGVGRSVIFDVTANQVAFDNINVNLVAVPEPFTVIGTIVGGTAALRLRKKLKATNKD